MPGPRPAGALIYAANLDALAAFYREVFGMTTLTADADHHVIENDDAQLILHAIPRHIAEAYPIATPPEPREEAAIKLFFTVARLSATAETVTRLGGAVFGETYTFGEMYVRNGMDNEGNIFHLRGREA
jgi:predicted enzyme related to lactoylglutathione lyase